ncbi:MAG TPA: hypothetical protein VMT67_03380 [Terriglobales bacterium]|nr:hypothetical protein [Terriglobales bacterium]
MRNDLLLTLFVITVLGAGFSQKTDSREPDKISLGMDHVKQLMLVMDSRSGKISKQEWMKFMEAEFDRLDTERKGEVDQIKIQRSTYVRQIRFSDMGR